MYFFRFPADTSRDSFRIPPLIIAADFTAFQLCAIYVLLPSAKRTAHPLRTLILARSAFHERVGCPSQAKIARNNNSYKYAAQSRR